VKNDAESWGLSWFIALTSYWFMPLLFWLAGSASWYALQRRFDRQYIKERLSRLFIPFVAGTLLVVPPQGYFALKMHGREPGNYPDFSLTFFPISAICPDIPVPSHLLICGLFCICDLHHPPDRHRRDRLLCCAVGLESVCKVCCHPGGFFRCVMLVVRRGHQADRRAEMAVRH
jgi:hypothetical protein